MNDDDLSPQEHADLRRRLVTGARGIRPVGAHRTAWIAASVAIVLVGGLSATAIGAANLLRAEPAPVATHAPTPTATPTKDPTPLPTATEAPPTSSPAVAFGGDCSLVLTGPEAEAIVGPVEPPYEATAFNMNSDVRAAAALLGGITCSWRGQETSQYIGISVYPIEAVSEGVRATYSDARCGMSYVCETGREAAGHWVGVGVTLIGETGFSDEAIADAEARAQSMIDVVVPKLATTSARAVPRDAGWWSLGDCRDLTPTVEALIGGPLDPTFPGDSIPSGMDWELLVDAGVDQWCPWNAGPDGPTSVLVEVIAQPGIGTPTTSEVAHARPIEIAGADFAWYTEEGSQPGDYSFVAVSGSNRLLVRYMADATTDVSAAAALVTALLAHLNG